MKNIAEMMAIVTKRTAPMTTNTIIKLFSRLDSDGDDVEAWSCRAAAAAVASSKV